MASITKHTKNVNLVKTQCVALNQNGIRCSRIVTDGNPYCWQHRKNLEQKSEIIDYLGIDEKSILNSYLTLEDILTIYADNLEERDRLIQTYYPELMDLDEASSLGYLNTVKYLVSLGAIPGDKTMYQAMENDHLEIVKYLYSLGVSIGLKINDSKGFYRAYQRGVFARKTSIGIIIEKEYLDIIEYILDNNLIFSEEITRKSIINTAIARGKLNVIKYLVSRGIDFDLSHLNDAIRFSHLQGVGFDNLDLVKYFYSIGITPDLSSLNVAYQSGNTEIIKFLNDVVKK